MEKKRIYLSSPTMHGEEQKFVEEAFATNWVAPLGPNVNSLETEMAAYAGIKASAALASGTSAIHLALKLLDIKEGDIVFVSDLTFSATVNPICYEKAVPVFIDSEKDTWNMDPKALEKAFKKYPGVKAVICVHLYGTPAKLQEITELCKKHGVPLIEDAAESLSATYQGKQTGTFGKFGIYSFNGNKIITSSGGGMLVSEDEKAIERARFLSTQARDAARHYQHSTIGYNYRMSNIVAGIGRGQLLHLEEHKQRKQEIYEQYRKAFEEIEGISMNPMNPRGESNCWLSCMTISEDTGVDPNKIMDALEKENIESRPIWKPMHLQPVFEKYDCITAEGSIQDMVEMGDRKEAVTVGEEIFHRGLCLPSDIKNTAEDMEKIISIIKGFF